MLWDIQEEYKKMVKYLNKCKYNITKRITILFGCVKKRIAKFKKSKDYISLLRWKNYIFYLLMRPFFLLVNAVVFLPYVVGRVVSLFVSLIGLFSNKAIQEIVLTFVIDGILFAWVYSYFFGVTFTWELFLAGGSLFILLQKEIPSILAEINRSLKVR